MGQIKYFTEDHNFKLPDKRHTGNWIKYIIQEEAYTLNQINYIFCSDAYLLQINESYLNHNTLTDIITFPYSQQNEPILADIFISIDRVKENALLFNCSFLDELHRVMIHGVLHLMGYSDKNPRKKAEMREKESACLSLRKGST